MSADSRNAEAGLDERVLSAVKEHNEPISLSALLRAVGAEGTEADVEVRHSLWRLIDDGQVKLDSKRQIVPVSI